MIDIEQLNKDFPILNQQVNGHPLTYLDSANTALTPEPVLAAMNEYYREYNANIHRGIYPMSERATMKHESARETVQQFINASSPKEIVFTRNATEAINLVVHTWGKMYLNEGDSVVLSIMEHHSNIVPWQLLQKEKKFQIHFIDLTDEGRIDQEHYQKLLKEEKVKFVSIVHQSNALGTINPIEEMITQAHEAGAVTLIDAAQSAAHMTLDAQALDSDFLVLTGHKLCGPTGIGVLYGKQQHLEDLPPFLGGGEMIRTVEKEKSTWNDLPYKYEAGTPNIAGAIGLGAAITYLNEFGMDSIQNHEAKLAEGALEKLHSIPGLKLFGPNTLEARGATFSFDLPGVHPHDIATILGERGVCVRAGNHCAQPLMDYLGTAASTRLSLSFYNTSEDVDRFIEAMSEVQKIFGLSS